MNKKYLVNVSDGRFTNDWLFVKESDAASYAKLGSYARIYIIEKELTAEDKK